MRPERPKSHSIETGPFIPGRIHSLFLPLLTVETAIITELKEALAAHPENLPNCRNCTHCGSSVGVHGTSGVTLIRCNHPDWGDEAGN
jgi:hypothetical protein